MKKRTKQLLAMSLALAMTLTSAPFSAQAAEVDETYDLQMEVPEEAEVSEEAEVLEEAAPEETAVLEVMPEETAASDLITLEPGTEPNKWQQQMIDRGYTMFVHFGLNTFTSSEWTYGDLSPATYAPSQIDADQWVKTVKEAGMKTILLVTKHHDGFCLWDSAYTDYDIGNPESGSQVDVVKAVSDACNKYGINLGIYYSAWDNNWDRNHGDPHNAAHQGHPVENDAAYNEYMRNQISELMSGKYGLDGKISELWIDGIWEKAGDRWEFDKLYDTVKKLQPECQIGLNHTINTGADDGWNGAIHAPNQKEGDPIGYFPSDFRIDDGYETSDNDPKLYSYEGGTYYLPFEATLILNKSWFWHPGYGSIPSRTPASIVEKYNKYKSEKNVLVLNCGPNRDGQIEQADIDSLYAAARKLGIANGDALKRPYTEVIEDYMGENLALNATGNSEHTYVDWSGSKRNPEENLFDGDSSTCWQGDYRKVSDYVMDITLDGEKEFNYVLIAEKEKNIRFEDITLEYLAEDGNWKEIFVDQALDSGRKVEFRLENTIKAEKLRMTATDEQMMMPMLSEFQLYKVEGAPELVGNPSAIAIHPEETTTLDIVNGEEGVSFKKIMAFSSEDETVATVDENGVVTAVAPGKTNILAKAMILGKELITVVPVKVTVGDMTALEKAIEDAELIDLDPYVEKGKKEFQDALTKAKEVLDDCAATQEQIDAAKDDLISAMEGLRLKANKEALEALLAEVADLDLSKYTKESADAFKKALATAEELMAAEELSEDDQQKIDDAVKTLEDAKKALEVKKDTLPGDDLSKPDKKPESKVPATGDTSNMMLWCVVLVCGAAGIVTVKRNKRIK